MPAKMISEMPLPMPRSLICSPSHMTKAVPVVSVITVTARKPQPGLGTSAAPPGVGHALQEEGDARALDDRDQHRAVARVLGDLAASQLAFLRQLLEVRPHHRQELQDDRRGDVGHDAQREHRDLLQAAAREGVDEPEEGRPAPPS